MSIVKHLDHVNLTVRSLAKSIDFYRRVFGFDVVESDARPDGSRWAILRAGEALLALSEYDIAPARDWQEKPKEARMNHFALRVTCDFDAVVQREGLHVKYGGQIDWPHSTSWYILDPSQHEIEVVRWHDDTISFAHAQR